MRALCRLTFFMLVFFTQFSTAGTFSEAILGENYTAINELIARGHKLQDDPEAVANALQSGSLEMLLFILNHGADPNSSVYIKTYKVVVNHVLSDALTIHEIVALLSFGADPYDYNEWEINHAFADQRWLHLVLYAYYFGGFGLNYRAYKAPGDVSELNAIVWLFPVLIIQSLVVLMDNNIDSEYVLPVLPKALQWLYNHSFGRDTDTKEPESETCFSPDSS